MQTALDYILGGFPAGVIIGFLRVVQYGMPTLTLILITHTPKG